MKSQPFFLRENRLKLYCCRLDGNIVGAMYCFQYKDKLSYYNSGFDPAFAKYSIGTILIACGIEEAISRGVREFDFLRGAEKYKYLWTNTDRKNVRLQLFRRSWMGRIFYSAAKGRLFIFAVRRSLKTLVIQKLDRA